MHDLVSHANVNNGVTSEGIYKPTNVMGGACEPFERSISPNLMNTLLPQAH